MHRIRSASFSERGIRVALGTDSLASNPDLSILAELRHVHQHYPDVPGDVLLRMATLSGAEALGWADDTGSLEAGKSADLVVVPLAAGASRRSVSATFRVRFARATSALPRSVDRAAYR